MKKFFNILLTLIIVFVFTNLTSLKASAASTAAMIDIHQSISKPSSKVFLTKNVSIRASNNSEGSRKVAVSLVNSQTGKVVAMKNLSNTNNKMVNAINLNPIPAGYYHIVLTCSQKTYCRGSAVLQGT